MEPRSRREAGGGRSGDAGIADGGGKEEGGWRGMRMEEGMVMEK